MKSNIYLEDYKKTIKKLKQVRTRLGMTQRKVASLLNKPQSYVSKSESGDRRIDIVELKKFARIYKKDTSFFLK